MGSIYHDFGSGIPVDGLDGRNLAYRPSGTGPPGFNQALQLDAQHNPFQDTCDTFAGSDNTHSDVLEKNDAMRFQSPLLKRHKDLSNSGIFDPQFRGFQGQCYIVNATSIDEANQALQLDAQQNAFHDKMYPNNLRGIYTTSFQVSTTIGLENFSNTDPFVSELSILPAQDSVLDASSTKQTNAADTHAPPNAADTPLSKRKTTCRMCGRILLRRTLPRHLRTVHEIEQTSLHQCDVCAKVFKRVDILKRHTTEQHGTEATPIECVHCGEQIRERALKDHFKRKKCRESQPNARRSYHFALETVSDPLLLAVHLMVEFLFHIDLRMGWETEYSGSMFVTKVYEEHRHALKYGPALATFLELKALALRSFVCRSVEHSIDDGVCEAALLLYWVESYTNRADGAKKYRPILETLLRRVPTAAECWFDALESALNGFGLAQARHLMFMSLPAFLTDHNQVLLNEQTMLNMAGSARDADLSIGSRLLVELKGNREAILLDPNLPDGTYGFVMDRSAHGMLRWKASPDVYYRIRQQTDLELVWHYSGVNPRSSSLGTRMSTFHFDYSFLRQGGLKTSGAWP